VNTVRQKIIVKLSTRFWSHTVGVLTAECCHLFQIVYMCI